MKLINPEIRIENSSMCNASCIYCPRDKMTRLQVIMPNNKFYDLVNQAGALGAETISIFGYGEPLMDDRVVSKVLYCKNRNLDTFITTNVSLLDNDMAHKLLNADLDHIRFSIHGIFKPDYEKVHCGLDYLDVFRNIMGFIELNNRKTLNKCKVSITCIPHPRADIETYINFWEPLCDWLELWKPHNWANGKKFRPTTTNRKTTCGRPHSGPIQINADGKMMVCCMDTDATLTVGDTTQESIEDIIKGDRFNAIRRKHENGDLSGLICETCDQLNIGEDNPLLYSNRDPGKKLNITSSTKFELGDN